MTCNSDFTLCNRFLAKCYEKARGKTYAGDIELIDNRFFQNAVVQQLAQALIAVETNGNVFGQLYIDGISQSLVTQLLSSHSNCGLPATKPKVSSFANWRLKRAVEYVDAHLSGPIFLSDLANAAGLIRMRFAAQFRAATRLRPDEYLLHRRIERAQDLLATSCMSLVDVAFSVGFEAQSHFTTVFKRFVGDTPSQ